MPSELACRAAAGGVNALDKSAPAVNPQASGAHLANRFSFIVSLQKVVECPLNDTANRSKNEKNYCRTESHYFFGV
jgi:hypothetical protein